jgi:hypothetical protein
VPPDYTARPHQGIAQRVRILRKPILGDLISEYVRAA